MSVHGERLERNRYTLSASVPFAAAAILSHNNEFHVIAATCEGGDKTIHCCDDCDSNFFTDYTSPQGHSWDEGTLITNATCTGEGVMEYRSRIEVNEAAGYKKQEEGAPHA